MTYVVDDKDIVMDRYGKVQASVSRPVAIRSSSQNSLPELMNESADNKSKLKLLGKSRNYTSRMKPVESIEEMSVTERNQSVSQSRKQLPANVDQYDSIHESKLNHMKTVVDRLYGKDIDDGKEYPLVNNADIFKDVLLDAERKNIRRELDVQRRRQMKFMQRMADDLENDLKGNLDYLEKANDDVEKMVKKVEVEAKQRELEILMLDIEEQIQEDNDQARKLEQIEAENKLSQLLKDNEALLEEIDKDLAGGMKPRNYVKPEQKSYDSKVAGSRVNQKAGHKLSLLKETKPKPNTKQAQPMRAQRVSKNPTPVSKARVTNQPAMKTVKKPARDIQGSMATIGDDTIRPADSMLGYSTVKINQCDTLTESIHMKAPYKHIPPEKNFFDD